jgi:hypothetical protein
MKEIYQKNWHDFFSNSRPVARRREYKKTEDRLAGETFKRSKAPNTARKNNFLNQSFVLDKNNSNSDVLNTNDIMNRTSLSISPMNLSYSANSKSANTTTNSEENPNLSTSSAKRGNRIGVMRVNNIDKPAETGNTGIKPPNHKDDRETIPSARQSSVTVQRVNKSAKLNETNSSQNDKSQTIVEEKSTSPSPSATETDQIGAIKIPANVSYTVQRERRPSMCSVTVIHLDKSSIETQKMTDKKKKTTGGVTVKKLPRSSAAKQSNNS